MLVLTDCSVLTSNFF